MKHVDAVFLDFDGVLAESVTIKSDAFRALYADQPTDVLAKIMAYNDAHDGISRVIKLRHYQEQFLGIPLSQKTLDDLVHRYAQMVEDAVVQAPWVPGAKAFLKAHYISHRLFVVSGTPEDELRRIVKHRGMAAWLTAVCGSPTTKADIVRGLLAEHGLVAGNCLFIGDAMADWDAAHETGMAFLGRVPPQRPSPFPAGTSTVADLRGLHF